MVKWLEQIGRLRDGLLVVFSAMYGVGYALVSLIAWRQHLPSLPLLDSQYLTTGAMPVLLITTIYALLRWCSRLVVAWWPSYLRSRSAAIQAACLCATIVAMLGGAMLSMPPAFLEFNLRTRGIGCLLLFVGIIFLPPVDSLTALFTAIALRFRRKGTSLHGAVLLQRIGKETAAFHRKQKLFILYAAPAIVLITLSAFYVTFWYERIPQSFGGGRPRCAALDVVADQLSPSTAAALGVESRGGRQATSRTKDVAVHFAGSSTVVATVQDEPRFSRIQTYEIPRELIRSIVWCE